jgi:hypothetical protein
MHSPLLTAAVAQRRQPSADALQMARHRAELPVRQSAIRRLAMSFWSRPARTAPVAPAGHIAVAPVSVASTAIDAA